MNGVGRKRKFLVLLVLLVGCTQQDETAGFSGPITKDTGEEIADAMPDASVDAWEPTRQACWRMTGGATNRARSGNCAGPSSLGNLTQVAHFKNRFLHSIRVGWKGEMYAVSEPSSTTSKQGHQRLVRIPGDGNSPDTLVDYTSQWDPARRKDSIALDTEGRIWVPEERKGAGELKMRLSAYSPDGTLVIRRKFDEITSGIEFVRLSENPIFVAQTDRGTYDFFRLHNGRFSQSASVRGISGQICSSDNYIFHLDVPKGFPTNTIAHPSVVVRALERPGTIVERKTLDIDHIGRYEKSQDGKATKCRVVGSSLILFPRALRQRFSRLACVTSTDQDSPTDCEVVDLGFSPKIVRSSTTEVIAPHEFALDVSNETDVQQYKTSVQFGFGLPNPIARDSQGRIFGVSDGPDSVILLDRSNDGIKDELRVVDGKSSRLRWVVPARDKLFVVGDKETEEGFDTTVYSISSVHGN